MSTRRSLAVLAIGFSFFLVRPLPARAAQQTQQAQQQPLVVLRLANNSLLVGRVVREEGDSVVFDAGSLGQITLKRADIVATLDPAAVAAAFQAASQPAPPPAASMSGFTEPGKVNWTRFGTFGGSFTSAAFKQGQLDPTIHGLTGAVLKLPGNQYQLQAQATVVRATNTGIFFADGSITYVYFEPFGRQAELPKFSTGYNFRFKRAQRLYGVTRYTLFKDYVRKIDYSNQLLFGLGIHAVEHPKLKMDLVPGATVMREKKGTRFDDQWLAGVGGLEQLTYSPNQFMQIEQRELFYQVFQDSSYRGLESYIGFKGMLSKQLGVQIGFSHIYDGAIGEQVTTIPANALFPGQPAFGVLANNKSQVLTTIGLLVRF